TTSRVLASSISITVACFDGSIFSRFTKTTNSFFISVLHFRKFAVFFLGNGLLQERSQYRKRIGLLYFSKTDSGTEKRASSALSSVLFPESRVFGNYASTFPKARFFASCRLGYWFAWRRPIRSRIFDRRKLPRSR